MANKTHDQLVAGLPTNTTGLITAQNVVDIVDSQFSRPSTTVTSGASYNVVAGTDCVIFVNKASGSATTINLPSRANGNEFTIKDAKGDAATNNITIVPAAGTIDGQASYVMKTNRASITVKDNGSEWSVL